jgi:hypothetical protein
MEYNFDDIDAWAEREAMNLEFYRKEVESTLIYARHHIKHFHKLRNLYTKRIKKYAKLKGITHPDCIDHLIKLHRNGIDITKELNTALKTSWSEFRQQLVEMSEYPWFIK